MVAAELNNNGNENSVRTKMPQVYTVIVVDMTANFNKRSCGIVIDKCILDDFRLKTEIYIFLVWRAWHKARQATRPLQTYDFCP